MRHASLRLCAVRLALVLASLPSASALAQDTAPDCAPVFERAVQASEWYPAAQRILKAQLPGTACEGSKMDAHMAALGFRLDHVMEDRAAPGLSTRRYYFSTPFYRHFFRKLVAGFGPSDVARVRLKDGIVIQYDSHGVK